MSAYPQPERLGPTPDQGEHTDEILQEFGYDAAAIAGLHEKGVV
jgi:crotonobetainyl-CoA:carnitine CoA-transferase CaiB-like acyl-CoA transferase